MMDLNSRTLCLRALRSISTHDHLVSGDLTLGILTILSRKRRGRVLLDHVNRDADDIGDVKRHDARGTVALGGDGPGIAVDLACIAVARDAGPGLGRMAVFTPTQAVALPLATMTSSLPPSAHTMRRDASSAEVSESGGFSGRPMSRPSSRRCGVRTSWLVRRMSSGKLSRRLEVRRARQLRASASMTRGTSASSSAEHTATVDEVTCMPGPTSTALLRAARPRSSSSPSEEKVPPCSAGSPTTGTSTRWDWTTGTIVSGTTRVT